MDSPCDEVIEEVRRLVKDDRSLAEWTSEWPGVHYMPFYDDPGRTGLTPKNVVLEKVYSDLGLRASIDEPFGSLETWDGLRNYYLFLKPYDLESQPELEQTGHIDFGGKPVPILYRGFKFMVSLVGTEAFSGNFSVFPASHKSALEILTKNPDLMSKSGVFEQMVRPHEPFEFIAKPGDVMFFHHLAFHAGNRSHSANRRPRIALAGEVYRTRWLTEISTERADLSPWERSLAVAGTDQVQRDKARYERIEREQYIREIEAERKTPVDDKWKHYSDWPNPPTV